MATSPQPEKELFLKTVWRSLRPRALGHVIDAGDYSMLLLVVLFGHLGKLGLALAGIEADVIGAISFLEKWAWIGSFAFFFARILLQAGRGLFDGSD